MMVEFNSNCSVNHVHDFVDSCKRSEYSNIEKSCELKGITRSVSEYRYSIVSGMEAYVRWSLGRSLLWPKRAFSFIVITLSEAIVHLSVTEVNAGKFETHQWVFSSMVRFEEIVETIGSMVDLKQCRYIFTPGRVRGLSLMHLCNSLTCKSLSAQFPHSKVIHLDDICRTSSGILVRRIGADVLRYAETLAEQKPMSWYGYSNEHDALTSAVESDSAALIKLIATPVSSYLQSRADRMDDCAVSLQEIR